MNAYLCYIVPLFVIFSFVEFSVASKCSGETSCDTCTTSSAFGLPCRWCPLDNGCHNPGAIGTNPCKVDENIVRPDECICADLFRQIVNRRNELAKRVDELRKDAGSLPPTKPDKPDERYGYRSIAGEIQQFENKQANLRKLLLDHQTKGCKQRTEDAWRYATKEAPKKVPNVDPEKVEQVAIVLGVGVAVLIAVFAAPELAAAGIMATLVAKIA